VSIKSNTPKPWEFGRTKFDGLLGQRPWKPADDYLRR
jgi:hypothetical protein